MSRDPEEERRLSAQQELEIGLLVLLLVFVVAVLLSAFTVCVARA